MSRILILGGTRFVGMRVAAELAKRHDVLVLSRNAADIPNAKRLIATRADGIEKLSGEMFDLVIDFIAYDDSDFRQVSALGSQYLAISSAWMPRLNGSTSADAVLPPDDSLAPATMMPVTKNYLIGKAKLERAIIDHRKNSGVAASVRLPILMGNGDHTGRLNFYRSRVSDGGPVLLVDGGANAAQVLWSGDAVRVVTGLIENLSLASHPIWDAVPDDGIPVRSFVDAIARNEGHTLQPVPIAVNVLQAKLPEYLEAEPLWRETPVSPGPGNLFKALGIAATPLQTWLSYLSSEVPGPQATRRAEIELVKALR